MINKYLTPIWALLLLFASFPAWSGSAPAQAKAHVEAAIAFYKEHGKEVALETFSKRDGGFVNEDLYIFVYDPQGTIIAHGGDPALVGEDYTDVQDVDGKHFAREFIKIGPEGGWVDYKWTNYVTDHIEEKTTYLQRVDDVIIGCGVYK